MPFASFFVKHDQHSEYEICLEVMIPKEIIEKICYICTNPNDGVSLLLCCKTWYSSNALEILFKERSRIAYKIMVDQRIKELIKNVERTNKESHTSLIDYFF